MSTPPFGTFAWGQLRGGRLTRGESVSLIAQGIRFRVWQSAHDLGEKLKLVRPPASDIVHELADLPDSRIAKDAEELVRDTSSAALLAHCQRTFLWGAFLANNDRLTYDAELLYVASLMHDLGLVEPYAFAKPETHCFAYEGAVHAREFASQAGWDDARSDALANAICLHLNVTVDLRHGPEAHLLHAGAGYDVLGSRFHEIDPQSRANVLDAYPRQQFKREVIDLLKQQNRQRPHCRMHLFSRLGFIDSVRQAPFDEPTPDDTHLVTAPPP